MLVRLPVRVLALALLGASIGCGGPRPREERPIEAPRLEKIGALQYASIEHHAEERSMELWVRLGAFDANPPQRSTALAWSFEQADLLAAAFPFATRFSWPCPATVSFSDCAERGLAVLRAPPHSIDLERLRERLHAGRLASQSTNADAREALRQMLDQLFEEPSRLRPLGDADDDGAVDEAALQALWERYYGANNALLVSRGFDPGAHDGVALTPLRDADNRFAVPAFSMASGQVRGEASAPGYTWTATVSSCFEVLAQLRIAARKLSPQHISHLIDVRGLGFLAVFLGPPPEAKFRGFLHTMVENTNCQTSEPVMRWLVGDAR